MTQNDKLDFSKGRYNLKISANACSNCLHYYHDRFFKCNLSQEIIFLSGICDKHERIIFEQSKPHNDSVDAFAYGMQAIALKKKPFFKRFINSYKLWRKHLGVFASLKAAWRISK